MLGSKEDRRRHLFKTYVDRMFERTGRTDSKRYPKEKNIRWLSWLARKMKENNQTVFLIERMQPSWLETKAQRRMYSILVRLSVVLSLWLIIVIMFRMLYIPIGGMLDLPFSEPINLLAFGLAFGLGFGWIGWLEEGEIKPTEALNWSWKKGRESLRDRYYDLLFGMFVGVFFGLVLGLIDALIDLLFFGLVFGLGFVLVGWLIVGLRVVEMDKRTFPNQGILKSAKNAVIIGLVVGGIFGMIGEPILGLVVGLYIGLAGGLFFGSVAGQSSSISPSGSYSAAKAYSPGGWFPSWTTQPSGYSCAKSAEAMSSSTGC